MGQYFHECDEWHLLNERVGKQNNGTKLCGIFSTNATLLCRKGVPAEPSILGGMQTVGDSHKAQHLRKWEMFKCLQKRIKACSSTNKFRKSYPYDFWIDVPLHILGDKCQGVLHFKKSYSKKRPWTRIIICSFEFDLKPHKIPTWCPMGLLYHRSWTWGELNLIIRNQGRLRSCFIHNECISFTKWGHVFEGTE